MLTLLSFCSREPARRYIEEHLKITALQVVFTVAIACPWLTVAPALSAVGLGSLGPIGGR